MIERRAVVVGQRAHLAAVVGRVRRVVGHQPAPAPVKQRFVRVHEARHTADPLGLELVDELVRIRAVAVLPEAVEALVAERRVAAAAQIQVAVPDAAHELAGAEHGRVQARLGTEDPHQGDGRVDLLHRGRRPADARPAREQLRVPVEVVDERAGLRPGGPHRLGHRRLQLLGGERPWRRRPGPEWGAGSGVRGGRAARGWRRHRRPGVDLGVVAARVAEGPEPGERDRRDAEHKEQADGEPVSQALSSSSTVCGPTHAIASSSAIPAAIVRTSSNVTSSSSAIVVSGSMSSLPNTIFCWAA